MRTYKKRFFILILVMFLSGGFFQSCDKADEILDGAGQLIDFIEKTGWLADKEKLDDIPQDITPFDNGEGGTLREVVSIENKFPPIGDQGRYGTCVTWAVGYNLKTSLNAIEHGWSEAQLSSSSNQTSPKDLWMGIPSSAKGSQCEGTNFEAALDRLIAGGASSLQSSPYANLGDCNATAMGDPSNKLSNYRKIAYKEGASSSGMTLENFQGYLNAGRPIAFGARLGDRFMSWNSSSVISSETYTNPGMQHAYHAMVLVGYDNTKRAFRVRNSWGESWGDKGSIWVDYTFFLNNFCFAAFVGQNVNTQSKGEFGTSGPGNDLMAYFAEDYDDSESSDPKDRYFSYEVMNSGTTTIYPSSNWSVVYMYYNAMDANDYKVIFEDYYTQDKGEGDGEYNTTGALAGGWWNNARVEPGKIAGETEYSNGFEIGYTMPSVTGKYYLVVMADSYDKIAEVNEDNNFYFISAPNGKPLEFVNGVIQNQSASAPYAAMRSMRTAAKQVKKFSNTEKQSLVKPGNLNTYTPEELKSMLVRDKKNGSLDRKVQAYRSMKMLTPKKRAIK